MRPPVPPPGINYSKVVFCKVNTCEDYYALSGILSTGEWIYRGHENSKWLLENSLERARKSKAAYINAKYKDNPLHASSLRSFDMLGIPGNYYIREFHAIQAYKSRSHQKNLSNIEALCNLQHYGGKTRLLDFTFSINLALFFAFENKYICQERCIWGINYKELKFKLKDPFCKFIKNECKNKNIDYKKLIEDISNIKDYSDLNDDNIDEYLYYDLLYDEFCDKIYMQNEIYKQIAEECIHESEQKSECKDLILPIEMPDQNPRISAQNGLFLFTTSFKPFSECLCKQFGLKYEENDKICPELYNERKDEKCFFEGLNDFQQHYRNIWNAKIVKIIFSEKFDDENNILKASNINAYTIYPDNVGIAKSIEYW